MGGKPSHELSSSSTSPSPVTCVFAGAVLINLDRRADRLRQFQKYYKASDLGTMVPLTRLSAVDAKALPLATIDQLLTPVAQRELASSLANGGKRDHHSQLTVGAVGCSLSHMEAWKQVAAQVALDQPWLIFEDDVVVGASRVAEALSAFYSDAVDAFEAQYGPSDKATVALVVNLTGTCMSGCSTRMHAASHDHVIKPDLAFGLDTYALTPRMAQRLLALASPPAIPMDMQLDSFLSVHPHVVVAMHSGRSSRRLKSGRRGPPVEAMRLAGGHTDIQSGVKRPGFFFR